MKPPTIRVVFDRKKTATKTKKSAVYIEVLYDRKRVYFSTGIKLYAGQYDVAKGVVNCADSFLYNEQIESVKKRIQSYILQSLKSGWGFSLSTLRDLMDNKHLTNNFLQYIENRIETRKDLRPNTIKSHRSSLHVLQDFGGIVEFSDITPENIRRFDVWLHERYDNQVSVYTYHKGLKLYINDAIRHGLLQDNPYRLITIPRGKTKARKHLDEDMLLAIRDATMPNESLSKVRDLFLFQCYTGMAYADMMKFDFSTAKLRNGKYIIVDTRVKTNEDFYIVLLTPAVEILKRYDFQLPKITNQQYNLRLKAVADYAKLTTNLTSHMARHTFAVYCLNHGIEIETLAKMMGHTNIQTTQIYAKIVNSTIEKAFDKLEDSLIEK